MLKRIPKSDITIRPFKAYKTWNFSSGSNEIGIFEAVEGDYDATDTTTSNGKTFYKNKILRSLFVFEVEKIIWFKAKVIKLKIIALWCQQFSFLLLKRKVIKAGDHIQGC
jgi:hypothetical protein